MLYLIESSIDYSGCEKIVFTNASFSTSTGQYVIYLFALLFSIKHLVPYLSFLFRFNHFEYAVISASPHGVVLAGTR